MSSNRKILFKAKIDSESTFVPYPPPSSDIVFGLLLSIDNKFFIQTESDIVCSGAGGLSALNTYPIIEETISQYTGLDFLNDKVFESDQFLHNNKKFTVVFKDGAFFVEQNDNIKNCILLVAFLKTNISKIN